MSGSNGNGFDPRVFVLGGLDYLQPASKAGLLDSSGPTAAAAIKPTSPGLAT
jgi:hypothetical protein